MNNLVQARSSRGARPVWLATSIVVMAAAIALAGVLAGQGNAAAVKAGKASRPLVEPRFKHPKLVRGLLTVKGTEASDTIVLRLQAGDPGILEVDVGADGSADFSFNRQRITDITVDAGAGDDIARIDEGNGAFTDTISTTLDGGDGNDTIAGGKGVETLVGGAGTDSLDGNGGNDLALLGAGDDTFIWDPGDGSDTVEGEDGIDTMVFNGAGVAERVAVSANGNRLRFLRDPGTITMDTAGVEQVDFNALGGADAVTVDNLSGTDVSAVNLDLGVNGGGDGQTDRVTANGTAGDDAIAVSGDASAVSVSGLQALVAIQHPEPTDVLAVNGLDGNDAISAAALAAQAISLTLDGGAGDDTIAGGKGVETSVGGDGSDSLDGNGGNDLALLGAGDDTFIWDPGDGSDTVEGEDGIDTMVFNGAAGAEAVDLSANGSRLRFFRDPGTITMDTAGVELVDFNALGGADAVTVNDLTGTDVSIVDLDLGVGGAGDGQPDHIVVKGTDGDDAITVKGNAGGVKVGGVAAAVDILHPEAANDRLDIDTLAGSDTVDSGGLAAGAIQFFVDGLLVP